MNEKHMPYEGKERDERKGKERKARGERRFETEQNTEHGARQRDSTAIVPGHDFRGVFGIKAA